MSSAAAQNVVRARDGDSAAFAEVVREFERTALAVAFAVLGDASAAADACQEAFVKAWRRLSELSDPGKFGPWLVGIVRNAAIDQRRAAGREAAVGRRSAAAEDSRVVPDPRREAGRREEFAALAAAITELDDVSREVVVLRYYQGLSGRGISELLGLSTAAVEMRLSRARQELRRKLEPASAGRSRGEP